MPEVTFLPRGTLLVGGVLEKVIKEELLSIKSEHGKFTRTISNPLQIPNKFNLNHAAHSSTMNQNLTESTKFTRRRQ
jgi:hypothetical protein